MRDTDIVKLIGLFMCVTLFFTQKDASSLNDKYIGLVVDTDRAKNLSWPDLIHHHFHEQLLKNCNNPTDVTGCVIYLLPWFAEHTHCVKPLELPEGSNLPRVARWNIKEIAMEFTKDIKMAEYQIISWP